MERLDDVHQMRGRVCRHLLCDWLLQQHQGADNAVRTNQNRISEEHIQMNNTPAFPLPNMNTGMTLRDYFAAKAMQAIVSVPEIDRSPEEYAAGAYRQADAMMAARSAT